jgi:hypothetical protein
MMDIATSALSDVAGAKLYIDVTDTGFTTPPSGNSFTMTSKVVATSVPGTETVQGYYDASNGGNNAFSVPGQASTTQQTVTSGVVPGASVSTLIVPGTAPFALTYSQVLTATDASQFFSTDNQLSVAVPAPASALLFASGLPVLTLGYLRKRFKKTSA